MNSFMGFSWFCKWCLISLFRFLCFSCLVSIWVWLISEFLMWVSVKCCVFGFHQWFLRGCLLSFVGGFGFSERRFYFLLLFFLMWCFGSVWTREKVEETVYGVNFQCGVFYPCQNHPLYFSPPPPTTTTVPPAKDVVWYQSLGYSYIGLYMV